jgi:hypothetical protein
VFERLCKAFLLFLIPGMLLYSQTAAHAFYPDITLVASDSRSVTLEFNPHDIRRDTVLIDGEGYININFNGSQSPDFIDPSGFEARFRPVTIAAPSLTPPNIEVVLADYEYVTGLRIPQIGDIERDEEEQYRTLRNTDAITEYVYTPVDVVDIGTVRGTILATLRIHPVRIIDGGSAAHVYSRMVVRVEFPEGTFGTLDAGTYDALRNVVLNIGQVGRIERDPAGTSVLRRSAAAPLQSSVLADGTWYSFTVEEDGVYRIDATMLQQAGINVSSVDPRTIKIYGSDGRPLPEIITAPRPDDLTELAIYVHGEDNGVIDSGDYVLFYGRGTMDWEYDTTGERYNHTYNYYSGRNVYFITYGGSPGKRMNVLSSLNESGPHSPSYFTSRIVYRDPKINLLGSGKHWMGQLFNQQTNVHVFTTMLHGFTPAEPIVYRIQVAARAPNITRFTVEDQGVALGTIAVPATFLGSDTQNYAQRASLTTFTRTGPLNEQRSLLRFSYDGGTSADGYLEWFEIHYPREYEAVSDYLRFPAPRHSGVVEYNIRSFSSMQVLAFDVSDFSDVKRVTDAAVSGGSIRFQVLQDEGVISEFVAVGDQGYKTPSQLSPVQNSNLRGITEGAELIIVSPPDFLVEAERLKQHRESFPGNRVSTILVSAQAIYNEFSAGLPDPTAIRDFIYYAYNSWEIAPRYVLLFGAGSFDFRRTLGLRQNYIPTYQTDESINQIGTYTSDDYFVQFAPGSRRPSIAIGRINAVSQDEARVSVDKIIHYETASTFGPWRNIVTYVADDGLTTRGGNEGNLHTWQSEQLANQYTPSSFEQQKIYIIEYPTETSALGRRKPEANRAIVNRFNEGALILNWTGHGNPRVWAHEWIFVREVTIPQLFNLDRLTFVTAATCDFSRIDDPRERSGAELLVNRQEGGAIGLLSATRVVFSADNAAFNNAYYANLLSTDVDGNTQRLGDALFATKQVRFSVNDIKFVLLGDPTLRLLSPTNRGTLTSINDQPISVGTVNLKALQQVRLEGAIRSPDGELMEDFDGRMFVVVYDSDKIVRIDEWGGYSYNVPGNVIFRGESSISAGRFTSSFVVPKDISHEGRNGRIALYFWDGTQDGRGFNGSIVLGGIDSTAAEDTQGPQITVFLEDRNFRSGDMVTDSPLLLVDLYDESGINTSGGGIGHRLEAWLNEVQDIDLTDYYSGKVDSYQEGTIQYQLAELPRGPHHLRLRAWDVYNNSSTEEVFFSVESSEKLAIENVYNYPNPFRDETYFTFQHNQTIPIDVEVRVYTVSGRLIAKVDGYGISDRFVRIYWSGLDDDGDRIANGVYLYKVIARTIDGTYTSEALGRMAVIR